MDLRLGIARKFFRFLLALCFLAYPHGISGDLATLLRVANLSHLRLFEDVSKSTFTDPTRGLQYPKSDNLRKVLAIN